MSPTARARALSRCPFVSDVVTNRSCKTTADQADDRGDKQPRSPAKSVGHRGRRGATALRLFVALAVGLGGASAGWASQVKKPFVRAARDGALAYLADGQGNRIPDFSGAGYGGGGVPLPVVPARVRVAPAPGDAGPRIQAAIDFVASLAPDRDGFRGAVVLAPGRYPVEKHLTIAASGVVLRGAGEDTVLVATGTDRRTLVQASGKADRAFAGAAHAVTDAYVPVGATRLSLDSVDGLQVGDRVIIERPSTKEWIAAIGMNDAPGREPFAWRAGDENIRWERTIVALNGTRVTVDAPLTTALDKTFGGGKVTRITWPGRISHVGVENLRCESVFDATNPKDEQHAWMAVALDNVEDAWVANVTAVHFCSSAVQLGAGTRAITVQDCACLVPVSEVGGYRRNSFHSSGQLTLFVRCRAEHGIHDFTVGYEAAGPNVFYDCRADQALGWSGSIGSWASGVLFDNVHIDGSRLSLDNLQTWNQGVGWSLANSVLWQCSASEIAVRRPPTANNWATGVWGEFLGDGWWDQVNEFVRPESLYQAQLRARRGNAALAVLEPRKLPAADDVPALDKAVPDLAQRLAAKPVPAGKPLQLQQGWLVANGALLTGKPAPELQWWRGEVAPSRAASYGAAITRFVPGQIGPGLTDDLDAVTDQMVRADDVVVRHHYGLWYDRRREDHERIRRATPGDWPPFFEQPFARSGQGEAWDRMSKYDLTKYNPWYFGRLREFADLSRQKGLVLINEMYFQHNILEAGAHWVDCPWRPANCLQPTGFPEPPPFTDSDGGPPPPTPDLGKRIFMASQFYDVSNPVRRPLHRAFIRQCLANLADEPNVIHTLTAENSGPLPFMQFWLDVVAEWEAETGRHPLIALSAPKDVQDAILADPKRRAVVDVIDLTYWWRTDAGKLFAPAGGTQWSPRQEERKWHGGRPTATSLAGMAYEYRSRFPDKAIITGLEQGNGWPFVAAGGSLAKLPVTTDRALLTALAQMQPVAGTFRPERNGHDALRAVRDAAAGYTVAVDWKRTWVLGDNGRQYFACNAGGGATRIEVGGAMGAFEARQIDPATGRARPDGKTVEASNGTITLPAAQGKMALWWVIRKS